MEATLSARETGAPEPIDRVAMFTNGSEVDTPVFERTALLAALDDKQGDAVIASIGET